MAETQTAGLSENAVGAIAYITFVPAIVFLVLPPYSKSSYVRFHAWQSIFLNLAAIIVNGALSVVVAWGVLSGAFFFIALPRLIWLFWILIWVLCSVKALNGKRFKLPLIGSFAEKQAGQ